MWVHGRLLSGSSSANVILFGFYIAKGYKEHKNLEGKAHKFLKPCLHPPSTGSGL